MITSFPLVFDNPPHSWTNAGADPTAINVPFLLVEEKKYLCERLIDKLNNTLIVKGDPSDNKLLIEEGLENMDAFIALTPNSDPSAPSSTV